ncbi:MAG: hypothetical protein ACRDYW_09415 [Acidimicrobiales bacterium]
MAVATVLSFLGGVIVANVTGSAAYGWTGLGVAAGFHTALTMWIARTHRLPFWSAFLLRDPTDSASSPPRPAARWAVIGSAMMALFSVLVIATGQPASTRLTYLAAGAVSGGILGFGLGDEYEDAGRIWKRFIQLVVALFVALFIFGLASEAVT